MLKGKIGQAILTAIAAMSMFFAAASASACFPLFCYQPKMPESMIKKD